MEAVFTGGFSDQNSEKCDVYAYVGNDPINFADPLGLQAPHIVSPQELQHYQTADGYLAEHSGASSTYGYTSGSDLGNALSSQFAPTTANYLSLAAAASLATGDLPGAAAFQTLAAAQSLISYGDSPTTTNALQTLAGAGVDAATAKLSPLAGFLVDYAGSDVANAIISALVPPSKTCP